VNLNWLKNFVVVAELGSLSRAADKLKIAQPTLSRQMKLLQDDFGTELFIRSGRGVETTEAGCELIKHAPNLLRQVDATYRDVQSVSECPSGEVRFATLPSLCRTLVSKIALRVMQEHPNISLRFIEGYSDSLIDSLQRGEIDVAVSVGPASSLHVKAEEILVEPLVFIGPLSSRLDTEEAVSMDFILQQELILPNKRIPIRALVEQEASAAHVRPMVRFEVNSVMGSLDMVRSGLGYTILPLSEVSAYKFSSEISYSLISCPRMNRHLAMIFGHDQPSRAMHIVAEIARETLSNTI